MLWLFGDTFISSGGRRTEATIIRNSIGFQSVSANEIGPIEYWFQGTSLEPAAVFEESDQEWLWPGHGAMIDGKCLIFMMVITHSSNDLGFQSSGWKVAVIHNPLEAPESWKITYHEGHGPDRVMIGTSSVIMDEQGIYAFGVRESQQHEVYLFRFPNNPFCEDSLCAPLLWDGTSWRSSFEEIETIPPLFHGQTEFSVHFDTTLQTYLQIQSVGFGRATIIGRTADHVTGPWSDPIPIYQPPVSSDSQIIYAAKAHPEFPLNGLLITYQINDLNFETLLQDESVYYPRSMTASWD